MWGLYFEKSFQFVVQFSPIITVQENGRIKAPFQYKEHLSRYGDLYCKDNTDKRMFYLYNKNPYTDKMPSLYWDSPQVIRSDLNSQQAQPFHVFPYLNHLCLLQFYFPKAPLVAHYFKCETSIHAFHYSNTGRLLFHLEDITYVIPSFFG